ncbi:MAG: cupin domain-containing protein [Piscirickettsiaceae bacterium]|nr:cupin domain-containing protein [Piscirickettsiaceae bacterium]
MAEFFNTGLSQQDFLDQYWQKKPLLIRQAFTDFESPITPDDLAGLACEPEIESRLIEENGQNGGWQVTEGPLSEEDFARLPATHWTMLVQDVDKHVPELQYLLDPFRFIPDWRRDDLMISYAPKHGTVGPHTDGYDVFLLQAMGKRRWQIGNNPLHNADLIAGLDVQILTEFEHDQEWELEAGDMLYLPPHFAHHGVALDEGMTFSFGFRAPSSVELLDAVINSMLEKELGKQRYSDPDLTAVKHTSEIDNQAVHRLKTLLHNAIDSAEPILTQALGKFVTDTKSSLASIAAESMSDEITIDELEQQFSQGKVLERSLYHRFAWSQTDKKGQLFMAGESYYIDINSINILPLLAENNEITNNDWQQLKIEPQSAELLCQLIAEGGWYWQEEASS